MDQSITFCIIGVSGAGKTTAARALKEIDPQGIHLPISMTTREPRTGEVPDIDYHFISEYEFETRAQNGEFMEHAKYNGHMYGPLLSEFEQAPTIIHVTEEKGALQLRDKIGAIIVVLIPPSESELLKRLLIDRDDEDHIVERIRVDMQRKDIMRRIADKIIINDDFQHTVVELQNYIKLIHRIQATKS